MPSDKRSRQRAGRAARMAELQRAQQRRQRVRRGIVIAVIIALAIGLAVYTSTSGGSKKVTSSSTTAVPTTTTPSSATTAATGTPPTAAPIQAGKLTGATPCPKPAGASPHITTFAKAPTNCLVAGKHYSATFTTNEGAFVVALNTTKTPLTANNFVVLAGYHYYDGTALFRTDTSIDIVQGGSPHTQSASDPGPGYTIKDEGSGYTYTTGDLAMARTSAPNSAGAQFFFCAGPACSGLNGQGTYVNFGHVTSGLAVLQKILGLNENVSNGLGGAPRQLVLVEKVTIAES